MAKLPKAVQASVDLANELQEQAAGGDAQQGAEASEPTEVTEVQAAVEQAPEQQETSQSPNEEEAPSAAEPSEPETTETTEAPENWEHKYKTLQGIFTKERGELNGQVQHLTSENEELKSRLDALEQSASGNEEPQAAELQQVTEADVDTFGADMVDLMRRVASEALAPLRQEFAMLSQELQKQLTGVQQQQTNSEADSYFSELTRRVPDWETINADPDFLSWLGELDPMSRFPRQAFLDNAVSNRDVEGTIAILDTWRGKPVVTPETLSVPDVPDLSRQTQPSTTGVSDTTNREAPADMWTRQDIENFYNDVRRGVFDGDPQLKAKYETEINAAVAEGRVADAA